MRLSVVPRVIVASWWFLIGASKLISPSPISFATIELGTHVSVVIGILQVIIAGLCLFSRTAGPLLTSAILLVLLMVGVVSDSHKQVTCGCFGANIVVTRNGKLCILSVAILVNSLALMAVKPRTTEA